MNDKTGRHLPTLQVQAPGFLSTISDNTAECLKLELFPNESFRKVVAESQFIYG